MSTAWNGVVGVGDRQHDYPPAGPNVVLLTDGQVLVTGMGNGVLSSGGGATVANSAEFYTP